jgi:hypothetical protein
MGTKKAGLGKTHIKKIETKYLRSNASEKAPKGGRRRSGDMYTGSEARQHNQQPFTAWQVNQAASGLSVDWRDKPQRRSIGRRDASIGNYSSFAIAGHAIAHFMRARQSPWPVQSPSHLVGQGSGERQIGLEINPHAAMGGKDDDAGKSEKKGSQRSRRSGDRPMATTPWPGPVVSKQAVHRCVAIFPSRAGIGGYSLQSTDGPFSILCAGRRALQTSRPVARDARVRSPRPGGRWARPTSQTQHSAELPVGRAGGTGTNEDDLPALPGSPATEQERSLERTSRGVGGRTRGSDTKPSQERSRLCFCQRMDFWTDGPPVGWIRRCVKQNAGRLR